MQNEFYPLFSLYTDEKLIEIITDKRDDYPQDALETAEQLLKERNYEIEFKEKEPLSVVEIIQNFYKRLPPQLRPFSMEGQLFILLITIGGWVVGLLVVMILERDFRLLLAFIPLTFLFIAVLHLYKQFKNPAKRH